jgi:hypothetical protein
MIASSRQRVPFAVPTAYCWLERDFEVTARLDRSEGPEVAPRGIEP